MYKQIILCLLGLQVSAGLWAQRLEPFSTEPEVFIEELVSKMEYGGAIDDEAVDLLKSFWINGDLMPDEKNRMIEQINKMVGLKYGLAANIASYTQIIISLKSRENYVGLAIGDFQEVIEEALDKLSNKETMVFLDRLYEYIPEGHLKKLQRFHWKLYDQAPILEIKSIHESDTSYAPVISFDGADLQYVSLDDSMILYNTSGYFNFLTQTLTGSDGRVDWVKVGLPSEDVYAEVLSYNLDVNRSTFEADSVRFYYKSLIDGPLYGYFEDRNIGARDTLSAQYPIFVSYSGNVVIEDWIPNVRYQGGFTLKGITIIGSAYDQWDTLRSGDAELPGTENIADEWQKSRRKARIDIKGSDRYVLHMVGETFDLSLEEVIGVNSATTIYTSDGDSIFHPGLDLSYSVDNRLIVLKKPSRGAYSHIPYTSSYHDFYLYFETLIWDVETDSVRFTSLLDKENKMAAIESFDYFKEARFNQAKHVLRFNPVGAIYRFALQHKDYPITPENIIKSFDQKYNMDSQLEAFRQSLPSLESAGYIKYDKDRDEIIPQPKLFKWTLAARGKKDYDALQLISRVDTGDHAHINLKTQELNMRGVPYFAFSDSQYVVVQPLGNEVYVGKDRGLRFGGNIAAGKLNLYANKEQNFRFEYETFKIICDSVDAIKFQLVRNPPSDYEFTPLEKALSNTVFENVSGAIHIDDPNNKSGKESNSLYPVFDSYQNSYIYWDKPEIQNGVYHRDSLYFAVYPFVLDSLDSFNEQGLLFAGEFYSSEILPVIEDTLTVMPDFTLGFQVETPEEGYDIFDYKGKFYDEVILDGSGLHGKGRLEHGGLFVSSDSIIFQFDSVMAFVDSFQLDQGYHNGSYFPQLDGMQAYYIWYPKTDQVVFSTIEVEEDSVEPAPINIFNEEAEFFGELKITEDGLVGNGKLRLSEVEVNGENIILKERDFEAVGASFVIIDTLNPDIVYFEALDVNVKYDVERHEASFGPKSSRIIPSRFEQHNYFTSLNLGEYNRKDRELRLEGGSDRAGDNFFKWIDPADDTLKFFAQKALYRIDDREIDISGVPNLVVADAIITPKDLALSVGENGLIDTLFDATIEADIVAKNHYLYESSVAISSANSYTGSGKYDYIEIDENKQFINFENIEVVDSKTTYAIGKVGNEEDFYLTDRILFKGTAELNAQNRFLRFDGEVKIESDNPVFEEEWFPFERTTVNPDSVFIPIDRYMTNDEGDAVISGLMYIPPVGEFYSSFLQPKIDSEDPELLLASGGLTVDRKTKAFRIGPEDKIKNRTYRGATVSYDDQLNLITSKGYLDFPYNFPAKTVSMEMVGAWEENVGDASIRTDLLLGINMDVLPTEPLAELVSNFHFFTVNRKDIDFLSRPLLENISELLDQGKRDDKATREFVDHVHDAMIYTDIDLAAILPYTFLLSNVDLRFDPDEGSLYSNGPIGLIGIDGKPVNKMIKARILYQIGEDPPFKEREPDKITIYLEVDEYNWAYFHFEGDVVRTVAPYDNYNVPILEESEKQKGNSGFRYELAPIEEAQNFKRSMDQRGQ